MDALGINPVLLIAQLISFTILYAVLSRFLYPVIRKALDDRRQAVAKTFADRDQMTRQLEEFAQNQKDQQRKSLAETRQLLDEAKKSAATARETLLDQARVESRKLVEKAKAEITRSQVAARNELADYARQIAHQTVNSLLSETTRDPKWQARQTRESLKLVAAAAKKSTHD